MWKLRAFSSRAIFGSRIERIGFRFHGLTGGFKYNYTDEELAKWAAVIKGTQAVFNCKTLGELLSD